MKVSSLVETPSLGVDYSHIVSGCRRLLIQRHAVIYTVDKNEINILRFIHQSKDIHRYL